MRKKRRPGVHAPGIVERIAGRIRGGEQLLVRAGEDRPLLLFRYPRGRSDVAREFEVAWSHTLRRLRPEILAPYVPVLLFLPALVVVLLRPRNVCECLGHHHPPGTESRLTRRLSADLGSAVGEIDLAYEGIRQWKPQPLADMAVGDLGGRLDSLHFQAGFLAVLLHEMEHLAFPEHKEQEIRQQSNRFYASAMQQLVQEETDSAYGMAAPLPRP